MTDLTLTSLSTHCICYILRVLLRGGGGGGNQYILIRQDSALHTAGHQSFAIHTTGSVPCSSRRWVRRPFLQLPSDVHVQSCDTVANCPIP